MPRPADSALRVAAEAVVYAALEGPINKVAARLAPPHFSQCVSKSCAAPNCNSTVLSLPDFRTKTGTTAAMTKEKLNTLSEAEMSAFDKKIVDSGFALVYCTQCQKCMHLNCSFAVAEPVNGFHKLVCASCQDKPEPHWW